MALKRAGDAGFPQDIISKGHNTSYPHTVVARQIVCKSAEDHDYNRKSKHILFGHGVAPFAREVLLL
jgi:hypothetical protein